jgi:hypothetical protein
MVDEPVVAQGGVRGSDPPSVAPDPREVPVAFGIPAEPARSFEQITFTNDSPVNKLLRAAGFAPVAA